MGPQDLVLEPEPAGSEGTEGSLCLPPTAPAPLTPGASRAGQLPWRGFLCLPGLVTLHEGCESVAVPVHPPGARHCQCCISWLCTQPSCLHHD